MAFLTLNTSYIAAGETFRLIITDLEGNVGDTLSYTLSGTDLTPSNFVGESSLSGVVTLGNNKSGFKDFITSINLPTGEEYMTLTVSSPGMNNIYLKIYSVNHYLTPKTKIALGDTFDVWRKKTNGFIARLDTLEDSVSEIKSQTVIADGINSEYTLNFPVTGLDTNFYDVNIDGIAQNPNLAYTINDVNNSIVFSEVPSEGASISIIHKYEISNIARNIVRTWGTITGDLSDQLDLTYALDLKADKSTTYTETEVDDMLTFYALAADTYTKAQTDTLLDDKPTSEDYNNIVKITQSDYETLSPKISTTLYIVTP